MIAALVQAMRPLFQPILRLKLSPPHLPEGTSEVQHLKPSPAFLTYRYAGTILASALKTGALTVAAAVAIAALNRLGWIVAGLIALYLIGFIGFLLVTTRLDWELRDYLIGDRSIRVREGAWVQREVTLSFANIQNVEVRQGPLQRLFGFKNLRVTTAGGSASKGSSHGKGSSHATHNAELMGLSNAEEIRDALQSALRHYRDAGLGDPQHSAMDRAVLLGEVRDAARALRLAAES